MFVNSTNSTNTLLRDLIAAGNPPEYIYTGFQTAGRGQTGNSWESEPNQNLLCSILLPPANEPFYLNVVVSVATHLLVKRSLSEAVSIKWPNDIYWGDQKLAGILIENAILGAEMQHAIAGIGLNVNQTEWHSNAPNPVSLKQITGKTFDLDELMQQLLDELHQVLEKPQEDVWAYYKTHLFRRKGYWPFVEREVNTTPTMNANANTLANADTFLARIVDVLPTGEILLEDQQGQQRTYHFKQIRYVL